MARQTWNGRYGAALLMVLGLVFGTSGCGGGTPPPPAAVSAPAAPTTSAAQPTQSGTQLATAAPVPTDPTPAIRMGVADPRLHLPFGEATVDSPSVDGERLPDVTVTGKSVGKLYSDVVASWDTIRFVDPPSGRSSYGVILETDLGNINITLRPDLAPNHVRSFIALCRVGYYDGLVFHRIVHAVSNTADGAASTLDLIEAGCPLGTGEAGYGSIGYWLKPEFSDKVVHEEGTVGACRAEEADTAACKFYITLSKAPVLDQNYTVFGKVTQGLDVARKIFSQPVRTDAESPEGDRPVTPVVIRKATYTYCYPNP